MATVSVIGAARCVGIGLVLLASAPPAAASAAAIDLSLPVMPNSIFEGMADAAPVEARSVGPLEDMSALAPEHGAVELTAAWRYMPDAEGAGESLGYADPALDDADWATMPVPSNFTRHDSSLADFFEPVWFRQRFDIPTSWAGRRLSLHFGAVDYFARVFVNGVPLSGGGEHEGYFAPFDFDITDLIKPGDNLVAVEVTNPYDSGQTSTGLSQVYPILGEKVWIKGILNFHDTRPGDSLGGAIMQTRGTGGIVQPVRVISDGGVDLRWAFLTPQVEGDGASLTYDAIFENTTGTPQAVTLNVAIHEEGGAHAPQGHRVEVILPAGMSRLTSSVNIQDPKLWYLWDQAPLGEPALYRFEGTVHNGRQALDRFEDRFGLRSIRYAEIGDEPFTFYLNGHRSYLRGSNTIPTQYMAESHRALHEADAALAQGAGMNALRVHAHVHAKDLYDVADEQGLALFQDMTLQWAYSVCHHARRNGDASLTSNAEVIGRMLAEMIYLHYNHPSIILWILHNEPLYAFVSEFTSEDGLGSPTAPIACPDAPFTAESPQTYSADATLGHNLDLATLKPIARAIDPTRPIHVASGEGDAHIYSGWYAGLYTQLSEAAPAMITEYGAEAAPFRGEAFMAEEPLLTPPGWPPVTDYDRHVYRIHDAQLQNYGMYIGRAHVSYGHYADWAFASQLYQAALLKFGGEHFRALRYQPTAVAVFFTFQNWWESFTWGIIDADRSPNIAHTWLGQSFAPTAVFVHADDTVFEWASPPDLSLMAVNDVHVSRPLTLVAELWEETDSFYIRGDPDAWTDFGILGEDPPTFGPPVDALTVTRGHGVGVRLVDRLEHAVVLPPDGALSWPLPQLSQGGGVTHLTWRLSLQDPDTGDVVTDNWYHFVMVDDRAAFTASIPPGIHPLPRFTLDVEVTAPSAVQLTLTRRHGQGAAFEGRVEGDVHLSGLLPGFYELSATWEGSAQTRTVHLIQDEALSLAFEGDDTPSPPPPTPLASTLTPSAGDGSQAPTEPTDGGCTCAASPMPRGGSLALVGLAIFVRRRQPIA